MAGYGVEIEELREAAGAAKSGGTQLAQVKPATALPPGLPGSRSGPRLGALADNWGQQSGALAKALTDLGTQMSGSADLYARNERAAAAVFDHQHAAGGAH